MFVPLQINQASTATSNVQQKYLAMVRYLLHKGGFSVSSHYKPHIIHKYAIPATQRCVFCVQSLQPHIIHKYACLALTGDSIMLLLLRLWRIHGFGGLCGHNVHDIILGPDLTCENSNEHNPSVVSVPA